MRWSTGLLAALGALTAVTVSAQTLSLLKVPYLTQSESLCGGAAAAMVMRYWGADGVSAESFSGLIDRSAAGIRTDVLQSDLIARGWNAVAHEGDTGAIAREIEAGRPAIALVEDRPGTYHYVVIVGWHPRGVVLHDPARTPYRVLTVEEFQQKWRASGEWMLAVSPGRPTTTLEAVIPQPAAIAESGSNLQCEGLIARGVAEAQANELEAAELTLASALACPGGDARRELAGVRLLQQRWTEVIELASSVLDERPNDAYAWQLLATARFVSNDVRGALRAWNGAGLPRVDLVQVEGLQRTRQRKVEAMAAFGTGDVLTLNQLERAERQLADWPAMTSTTVTFVPKSGGKADVRIGVTERDMVPRQRIALGIIAGRALISRELRVAFGPMTTEGERLEVGWRFWPDRPRYATSLVAPAPWGGLWGIQASVERQPFTQPLVPTARRDSAGIAFSGWQSGHLRWQAGGGIDRWTDRGRFATLQGAMDVVTFDDGLRLRVHGQTWVGGVGFSAVDVSIRAVRALAADRYVLEARAGISRVSTKAPLDIWPAGDTGHARPTLLRAHPLLTAGRYRTQRLGAALVVASVEGQRLWRYRGVRFGPAVFADVGRTSNRFAGDSVRDADVGLGLRVRIAGMSGAIRIDAAKGLRDGSRALSFVYEP